MGNQATDYDLMVYDPSGNMEASSTSPEYTESIEIKAKGNKTLDEGTWIAQIGHCALCRDTEWHLTIVGYYKVPAGDAPEPAGAEGGEG